MSTSPIRRGVVAALVGGATLIGGSVATAPSASAAGGNVWDRVAQCESGGNWQIATGNGYYGGLQFSATSWRGAGGKKYANLPHQASRAEQIAVAKNLLRMQGPGAWPVCSRRAGLTRANGLAADGGAVAAPTRKSTQSVARHQSLTRSEVRELQRKVGAGVDGIVGRETVRKTQQYLGQRQTGARQLTGATLAGAVRLVRG